jgi:cation diffusion facilitator CzcD-associated flavoprotein CzcO
MQNVPDRVCIIGAGLSGIAACKVLKDHGIAFDCYEASDRIGGNWAYGNPNKMSSIYKSLFTHTSKLRTPFSDYPMPAHYPIFLHHTQMAEYLNNYVDHFSVRQDIHFTTVVVSAVPLAGRGWQITLQDGSTHHYRALLVANGHTWDPQWPEPPFPGHFAGDIIHSHFYQVPDPYIDKRVLVLGFGNSAMDIAVETSRVSVKTYLAVRRGFYVLPKYILGRPLDHQPLQAWLPPKLARRLLGLIIKLETGKFSQYGLPEPDHKVLDAHPTISSDILTCITHGRVTVKPTIREFDHDSVIFTDGTREKIDSIIYCTGYKVTFPFFTAELAAAVKNELPLFFRIFHPHYQNLFFIGLLQPIGPIMPLVELQSLWVSKYLLGQYTLPPQDKMLAMIHHERKEIQKRYGNSPRHTIQVDFESYVRRVLKEIKHGQMGTS